MSSLDDLLADLTSGDDHRAEAAASALKDFGESALPKLVALLRSSNADERWWAVRTLAQMGGPRVEDFIRGLRDESADVREAAALALSAYPAEEAAPALIGALSDEDAMVASLAVTAIIAIGKPAVPVLLSEFEHASPSERIHMMRALAEIRDHRAIPAMIKAMDEDSALLHYWAKEGLERLGLNMVYMRPE